MFAVIQYAAHGVELASQTLTVTVLFLPLSAMWAAATVAQDMRSNEGSANAPSFARPVHGPLSISASSDGEGALCKDRVWSGGPASTDIEMTGGASWNTSKLLDAKVYAVEKI
jgi:hypothetical protein